MNSESLTFDDRKARIVVGAGMAFLVWMLCAMHLAHRCLLGYKWFENYSPAVIGLGCACCIVFQRKLVTGVVSAVALGLAFHLFVIAPYLDWIHGPNRPHFAAEDRIRMINDLRLVDIAEETNAQARTPETPETPSK